MNSMQWETVIGLEVHAQLSTASKIFSGASTAFGAAPNSQACQVDIALPGVLPVLNRGAVERAIRFGLAIGARLNRTNVFARKNYFYPDLPKGYQISQFESPIVEGGVLTIQVGDEEKTVRLTRAHLEEDAGKSLHEEFHSEDGKQLSGIDLNRAGTPLLEIVSEPDMRSAREAVAYAKALHTLVTWIGICDGNMQEGSFRCDANVSVRRPGGPLGTRREIKNLNSFRFLEQAIDFEVRWQIEQIEDGHRIQQATVLFDPDSGETRMMRSKEDAHDYRYFPDPDLLPVRLDEAWIAQIQAGLPELPGAMRERFQSDYGFSAEHADFLVSSRASAENFDQFWRYLMELIGPNSEHSEAAVKGANWAMGEFAAMRNAYGLEVHQSPVGPRELAKLVARILDGTISHKLAKQVFEALWNDGGDVDAIIEAKGLRQMSDSGEIERIIDEVMAANQKSVEEFRAGKDKAFNALVGQVMKATRGKANPSQVNELLRRKLEAG